MHGRIGAAGLLVVGLLCLAPAVYAQPASEQSSAADAQVRSDGTQAGVDVSRLPLNLERIQREIRESTIREERDGLNIHYVVGVFGQAPPFQLFTAEDNLVSGPVPYGAPTHQEILEHITPREYRAPAADISALLRWLAERAKR